MKRKKKKINEDIDIMKSEIEFCIKAQLINTLVDFFPIIKCTNQEEYFVNIYRLCYEW